MILIVMFSTVLDCTARNHNYHRNNRSSDVISGVILGVTLGVLATQHQVREVYYPVQSDCRIKFPYHPERIIYSKGVKYYRCWNRDSGYYYVPEYRYEDYCD